MIINNVRDGDEHGKNGDDAVSFIVFALWQPSQGTGEHYSGSWDSPQATQVWKPLKLPRMVCITEINLCDGLEGIVPLVFWKEFLEFPSVAFERALSWRGNITQWPINMSAKCSLLDLQQPTETSGKVQTVSPMGLCGIIWYSQFPHV